MKLNDLVASQETNIFLLPADLNYSESENVRPSLQNFLRPRLLAGDFFFLFNLFMTF